MDTEGVGHIRLWTQQTLDTSGHGHSGLTPDHYTHQIFHADPSTSRDLRRPTGRWEGSDTQILHNCSRITTISDEQNNHNDDCGNSEYSRKRRGCGLGVSTLCLWPSGLATIVGLTGSQERVMDFLSVLLSWHMQAHQSLSCLRVHSMHWNYCAH